MVAFYVAVAVPVAAWKAVVVPAPDLDEADAAFEQASSDEAFASEEFAFGLLIDVARIVDSGSLGCQAIHVLDVLRFLRDVERVGGAELHRGGKFITADAGGEPVVTGASGSVQQVQLRERIEPGTVGSLT